MMQSVKTDVKQPGDVELSGGRQTGIKAPINQDSKEGSQESARRAPSDQEDIKQPVVSRGRLDVRRTR